MKKRCFLQNKSFLVRDMASFDSKTEISTVCQHMQCFKFKIYNRKTLEQSKYKNNFLWQLCRWGIIRSGADIEFGNSPASDQVTCTRPMWVRFTSTFFAASWILVGFGFSLL